MKIIDTFKRLIARPKSNRPPTPQLLDQAPVPERLPTGGSAAEERLREAEHQQGRAPARDGAEPKSDE